ncbi:hypothetical protein HK101_004222 [Irineochytrium annulatum]|nr:hypothetical protein HK101_004222 [Irineochytrium annulatum]
MAARLNELGPILLPQRDQLLLSRPLLQQGLPLLLHQLCLQLQQGLLLLLHRLVLPGLLLQQGLPLLLHRLCLPGPLLLSHPSAQQLQGDQENLELQLHRQAQDYLADPVALQPLLLPECPGLPWGQQVRPDLESLRLQQDQAVPEVLVVQAALPLVLELQVALLPLVYLEYPVHPARLVSLAVLLDQRQ